MKCKSLLNDVRYEMFERAIRFVNYELLEGCVVELGVYTGRSLALLLEAHLEYIKNSIHKIPWDREFIGLDNFEGLPENNHARWHAGIFKINHSEHPTINQGEIVTAQKVLDFFSHENLPLPKLIVGEFSETTKLVDQQIAIAHFDCDLYQSTMDGLLGLEDKFQQGTLLLFDDWFNYKGRKDCGEQKAVNEWLKSTNLQLTPYFPYGTFCQSFIVQRDEL